jgi:hypothetical protein
MGTIFEELIRKFNEALNENPGEHFTPRDVVHLMVDLMLAGDEKEIRAKKAIRTVYDPCCGSGGMLMITKEHITIGLRKNGGLLRPAINRDAEIHLFGQESQPETWAVAKSDMFMKDPTGRDADHIAYGSTLSNDRHAGETFDYLIANPPYGKDWKRDETATICRDKDGNPEPDPELRDTESVPLGERVEAFFEREVKPHVPDAWIDTSRRDPRDGQIGLVGYEINFNRYKPPRPLEEIEGEIRGIEPDILRMLAEVTGGPA